MSTQFRPRFGKLPAAVAYSGRGRSRLYEWASIYPGLFRKDGASTLVDFDKLDAILDQLPVREIKAPRRLIIKSEVVKARSP